MKKILLIIAFLISVIGFSQEQDNYKKAATTFEYNYNNGDVVSIFNMFDTNFKKVLTLEKTKTYFKTDVNMDALGKIKSIEYLNTVRTGHNYKITFENGVYNAFFMLGADSKLESFLMNPIKNKQ